MRLPADNLEQMISENKNMNEKNFMNLIHKINEVVNRNAK
jgi:hypothetical protein